MTGARSQWGPVRLHVVEPGTPGSGVYAVDQPDYLILNTPCGQVSLYPWQDVGPSPAVRPRAVRVGHRHRLPLGGRRLPRSAREGRKIGPDDYLPRRLMGEYLQWFYDTLVASAPPKVEVIHHHTEAVNIVAESVRTRTGPARPTGTSSTVDHVILTSGHTDNVEPPADPAVVARPYPVDVTSQRIPRGATVAVEGMGLVATDVVMALTLGRGGSFTENGDRLRYVRSGDEPSPAALLAQRVPLLRQSGRDRRRERRVRGGRLHQAGDRCRPGRCRHGTAPAPDRLSLRGPAPHPGRDADQVLLAVGPARPGPGRLGGGAHPTGTGLERRLLRRRREATLGQLRRVRPVMALLRPAWRLRLLEGLRVADLLDSRGRPARGAPRAARRRSSPPTRCCATSGT